MYPDIAGDAAVDGTGSHLLLELCLKHGCRAEMYVGQIIGVNHHDRPGGWTVQQDRALRVQMCLDYISTRVHDLRELYSGCKVEVLAESKSNPGALLFNREDWWGTCDVTITVTNTHKRCLFLEVIDYKDGRGYVDVHDNTQLLSYLLGKIAEWPVGHVVDTRRTIVQPKTTKVVRYEDTPAAEILGQWQPWFRDRVIATDDPAAPLVPDNENGKGYCRWCKHRQNCGALRDNNLQEIATVTQDLIPAGEGQDFFGQLQALARDVTSLSDERLTQLYDIVPLLQQVCGDIGGELEKRVKERGVPGFAMRPGRHNKIWNVKDDEVLKTLKSLRFKSDEMQPRSLVSPAQALKHPGLSEAQIEKLKSIITEKASGEKLSRVSFTNTLQPEEMFGELGFIDPPALSFLDPEPVNFL